MKVLLIFLVAMMNWTPSVASQVLVEGDTLPEGVSVPDQNESLVHLDDYRGKWLILYFYPKDDTPGCKREAITYSGLIDQFSEENAVVFGINTDSAESHRRFIKKYDLKIDLLVDKGKKLINLFDVSTTFGFCSRDTVLISPQGKVQKIYRGVSPEGNPKEILSYLQEKED